MDKQIKKYTLEIFISSLVLVAGITYCMVKHTEWAFMLIPVLGCFAVLLTWGLLARFVLARNAERYLCKSFVRPLYYALQVPLWMVYTFVLFALPVDSSEWSVTLTETLVALLITVFMFVAPVIGAVLGVLSLAFGVKHLKNTPQTESHFYREGPLVLSCLLGVLVMALCVFGVFFIL